MKKDILYCAITVSLAYLSATIVEHFLITKPQINVKELKKNSVDNDITPSLFIKQKVVIKQVTKKTEALNNWSLNATIIGQPSYAFMFKGKDSQLVKTGQELEGYKLIKVEKERALFSNKTKKNWVYLKNKIIKQSAKVKTSKKEKSSFVISKNKFKKRMNNPSKLLKDINITPHLINNVFQGLKVNYLRKRSFLDIYGLEKSDLITKINGKKLLSIADALNQYQKVMNMKNFTIEVKRNNQRKVLSYGIK